jgi:hypothetical protein
MPIWPGFRIFFNVFVSIAPWKTNWKGHKKHWKSTSEILIYIYMPEMGYYIFFSIYNERNYTLFYQKLWHSNTETFFNQQSQTRILLLPVTPRQTKPLFFYAPIRIIHLRPAPLSMYSRALFISEKGTSWVMNFSSSSSCHITTRLVNSAGDCIKIKRRNNYWFLSRDRSFKIQCNCISIALPKKVKDFHFHNIKMII